MNVPGACDDGADAVDPGVDSSTGLAAVDEAPDTPSEDEDYDLEAPRGGKIDPFHQSLFGASNKVTLLGGISIKSPVLAKLMLSGIKTVENRSKHIPLGWYALQLTASASTTPHDYGLPSGKAALDYNVTCWSEKEVKERLGYIVGCVKFGPPRTFQDNKAAVDAMGPWADVKIGKYVHPILDFVTVPPFSHKGQVGVWKLDKAACLSVQETARKELNEKQGRLPPSPSLSHLSDMYLSKLLPGQALRIATALSKSRGVRVGTMCSGSDVPIKALEHLCAALAQQGHDCAFTHEFSVELDETKREWIKKGAKGLKALFADATTMSKDVEWCYLANSNVVIPPVDLLIAGFSCKALSGMNNDAKELRRQMAKGAWEKAGCSGRTLLGIIKYLEKHRPAVFIWENVWAIMFKTESGCVIDSVVSAINKAGGFKAHAILDLNANDYMMPQRRKRIYGVHVREPANEDINTFSPALVATLERFKCTRYFPLSSLMTMNEDKKNSQAGQAHVCILLAGGLGMEGSRGGQ